MTGYGISHGCVSVINGIVTGTGAVIGIALETSAEYSEMGIEQAVYIVGEDTDDNLARICVRRTLEALRINPSVPYMLTIKSEIPPSRGLKSSSSVCNAIIRAVLDEHHESMETMDIIKLGVECAKEAKVTITGSFDDACGCELDGFIMTENYRNEIVRHEPFPVMDVVICVPDYVKKGVPREAYELRAPQMEEIKEVCRTDILKAMTMNGRLIADIVGEPSDLIDAAMESGALAAGISGTGPAIAIICDPGTGEWMAEKLGCNCIVTRTR